MDSLKVKWITFLMAAILSLSSIASELELVDEVDGIKVYKAYDKELGLDLVRVTKIVDPSISIDAMVKINTTPEFWPSWMPKVTYAKFVEPGETDYIVHIRYNSPWPVQDRDSVTRAVLTKDPETEVVKLDFNTVDAGVKADDDYVRVPYIKGFWTFEPINNGSTLVTYQTIADPGGGVPKFLVNLESTKIPVDTMVAMLENIDRFKDAKINWPE